MRKGGSEEPPQGCAGATWPSWRAWPLALASFVRCRVVGLDRKRLVFHAVSRVRLGLDLAFNDDRRPGLEGGGELGQRPPKLNQKHRLRAALRNALRQ